MPFVVMAFSVFLTGFFLALGFMSARYLVAKVVEWRPWWFIPTVRHFVRERLSVR